LLFKIISDTAAFVVAVLLLAETIEAPKTVYFKMVNSECLRK